MFNGSYFRTPSVSSQKQFASETDYCARFITGNHNIIHYGFNQIGHPLMILQFLNRLMNTS